MDVGLENAAPGLIIRKRKQVEEPEKVKVGNSDSVESIGNEAEDAVALLLKHTRGIQATGDDDIHRSKGVVEEVDFDQNPFCLANFATSRCICCVLIICDLYCIRSIGGDGWTSLNDRLGY